jgi:aminoglycoside phosphotransferase (APT) family kinase protein
MTMNNNDLAESTARRLLEKIAPGSVLDSIAVADGSFSNYTHIVNARLKDGQLYKIVVRRYKIFGNYDRGEKARREFKTFELLNRHGVPAPEALFLDETGDVLEIPGIVTRFVEGSLMLEVPPDPIDWARKLAIMLANIHRIPCGENEESFLLKGNSEVTWFLHSDSPPEYMQTFPGGAEVWQTLRERVSTVQFNPPTLMHIDYWSGNILWDRDEISAVIDWEEAALGDPVYDLAYAYMNMILMGLPAAAAEFLRMYESETGRQIRNLGFWGLAASVRPMTDQDGWDIASGRVRVRLRQFIAESLTRAD